MNFKSVTDELFVRVTQHDLASALGVSVALIRQGRLNPDAAAHRSPPDGWEKASLRLAENAAAHYERLARKLRVAGRVKN